MLFSPQNRLAFCQKHFTQKNTDPQGYAAPTQGHFPGELQEVFTVTFQIFPDFSVASRLAPVSSCFSPKGKDVLDSDGAQSWPLFPPHLRQYNTAGPCPHERKQGNSAPPGMTCETCFPVCLSTTKIL